MQKLEKTDNTMKSLKLGMENMAKTIKELERKMANMTNIASTGNRDWSPDVTKYRESRV